MIKQKINAGSARYLSEIKEFEEGLPHGVLSKKATDVGGTFATLKSKWNYIIVCPFRDLVDSICEDKNSPYKVFGKYKGLGSVAEFKEYIKSTDVIKIAVTFDSFPIMIDMIKRYSDISSFKVLIDEYHLILEDLGFREKAITNLMNQIKQFKHYTFMSATPINEAFLPKCIEDLPFTEIVWSNVKSIKPRRIKTPNVYKTVSNLITEFKKGLYVEVKGVPTKVEELYLFLNSVQGIKEIITTCKLDIDEIKVACAERVRNSEVLKNIEISKATDPNKPINFFTKKCFQGCNLFSNNGLVVIISDGSKNHTLIDVETTIYQIVGRLRSNSEFDNILKDKVWHIYSTKRPGSIKTDEQFEAELSILKAETDIAINMSKKMSEIERKQLIERYNIDNLICYYDEDEDAFVYSDIKEKYLKYNFHLCNHIYKNGATIREAYVESGLQIQKQEYDNLSDDVVLNRIATVSFRSLLEQYIELRQTNSSIGLIQSLENEYPIFKQAYNELGISKIKSSGYVESKIKEMLYARSAINTAFEVFYNKYGDSTIPVKEIKKELQEIYDRLKISNKAKATDLKNCIWLDVKVTDPKIEGKTVRCMSIQKRMMYQL